MSFRITALALLTALFAAAEPPVADSPFSDADRSWWAFQPVERTSPPATGERHPIDAFIAERLAKKGLALSEPADKVTLLRRVTFDLIGLPPTPEELQAFLSDDSPEAFEKVVDRLLASPQYGERWARHWLDLARYAESNGFKSDETRPTAWTYRDYVIRSFNQDKPYDRFVAEQIAGDELWPESPDARVATAFNRHYPDESNAANLHQRRAEMLQDVTDAVGATFLGLTVGCAKCHDHKFDPILQKDYYRLQAFFANIAENDEVPLLTGDELARWRERRAEWEAATADIRAEMEALLEPVWEDRFQHLYGKRLVETQEALDKPADQLTPLERHITFKHQWQLGIESPGYPKKLDDEQEARYRELEAELETYAHLDPGPLPVGMAVQELGSKAPETHVLSLANYAVPGAEVEPGFLSILDPGPAEYDEPEGLESSGRRSTLAKWLADESNPLTARVMANRVWHYHFGQGIVATPSDFGRMGQAPTHPELLDWLTAEFIDRGWSVKQLHRLILTSKTYQQASVVREQAQAKDPFNRLLWRFPTQRLEGEVIRDAMLSVSGMLNPEMGGPSVMPPLPEGMPEPRGGWEATDDPAEQRRRSIYIFVRRNSRYPMMAAFDMPDTHETCARRNVTTTAPQALSLLNDPQTIDWARGLAGRVLERAGADRGEQVEQAYLLAYSRRPDGAEKDAAYTFFEMQRKILAERAAAGKPLALPTAGSDAVDELDAAVLVDFSHALLNSNEFVYRR